MLRFAFCLALFSAPLAAQNSGAPSTEGIVPEWEVRKRMATLAEEVQKLEPILGAVKAREWVSQGAPDAYVRQSEATHSTVLHAIDAAGKLARQPERLSAAIETYFRLESVDQFAGSLADGIRKYQSPALADQLTEALAKTSVQRDLLKQHILDLAMTREKEYTMLDSEVQRCRGLMFRNQPAEPRRSPKKAAQP